MTDKIDLDNISRVAGGVELISAAAIRRYAAEGLGKRQIANRLGCNHFLVERALREHTHRQVVALDRSGVSPSAIATKLGITIGVVRCALAEVGE